MKTVNLYVCEVCSAQYRDESHAKKCEENHKKINHIGKVRYLPISENKPGYPVSIEVVMDDGERLTFKR